MMEMVAVQTGSTFPVLNAMIVLPALGALVVVLLPNSRPEMMRPIGAIFSSMAAAMSLFVMTQFSSQDPGFQFESIQSWIPALGINWHVGVDGISLWLVVLTGF
ncbi:MAG: Fe-S-binding domain-containing protein, partial [Actinomycetota bacterium]|nr:Fe-S-binding domain-containing protein [Actinomycetota bacterium]